MAEGGVAWIKGHKLRIYIVAIIPALVACVVVMPYVFLVPEDLNDRSYYMLALGWVYVCFVFRLAGIVYMSYHYCCAGVDAKEANDMM
eukprot:SAG11_NODE_1662_length_4497_cov_2.281492_6_plen_88_part_00